MMAFGINISAAEAAKKMEEIEAQLAQKLDERKLQPQGPAPAEVNDEPHITDESGIEMFFGGGNSSLPQLQQNYQPSFSTDFFPMQEHK